MAAGSRRRARTVALQALFEADSSHHSPLEVLERMLREQGLPAPSTEFARALVQGVLADQERIDQAIARVAPAWPVDQLPAVDRNILRLAIHEILGDNGAPVKAVINEAIELAKSFGSENSAKFINGVLGTIERQRSELIASGRPREGGD
jgi:N utilization substance protein B